MHHEQRQPTVIAVTCFSDWALEQLSNAFRKQPIPGTRFIDGDLAIGRQHKCRNLKSIYYKWGPMAHELIGPSVEEMIEKEIHSTKAQKTLIITVPPQLWKVGWEDIDRLQIVKLGMSVSEAMADLRKALIADKKRFDVRHENFGAWNEYLMTTITGDRYEQLPAAVIKSNINDRMDRFSSNISDFPVYIFRDWYVNGKADRFPELKVVIQQLIREMTEADRRKKLRRAAAAHQ